jgi:hypothetical protein
MTTWLKAPDGQARSDLNSTGARAFRKYSSSPWRPDCSSRSGVYQGLVEASQLGTRPADKDDSTGDLRSKLSGGVPFGWCEVGNLPPGSSATPPAAEGALPGYRCDEEFHQPFPSVFSQAQKADNES